ncbi:MAG: hypothetical protein MZV64_28485 [Ignavibacteriales bacterium]|nr:hypothetical protein [Ignavibacteriales bacterium]
MSGCWKLRGSNRLVGCGVYYGASLSEAVSLPRPRCLHHRWGQFRGTGSSLLLALRAARDDHHPGRGTQPRHGSLSCRADQRHGEHHRPRALGSCRGPRLRPPGAGRDPEPGHRGGARAGYGGDVHLHRDSAEDGVRRRISRKEREGVHRDGARSPQIQRPASRVDAGQGPVDVRNERPRRLRGGRRPGWRQQAGGVGSRGRVSGDLLDPQVSGDSLTASSFTYRGRECDEKVPCHFQSHGRGLREGSERDARHRVSHALRLGLQRRRPHWVGAPGGGGPARRRCSVSRRSSAERRRWCRS